jgi:geranylgeranyl diphosphate synthase, type II
MASASTAAFLDHAASLRAEINSALERYTEYGTGCPPNLREAIRHSLLAPCKRLRPLLVLMAAEACGCTQGEAMPAACAVEMIHTYSLIHDDLPAMDDDDLRRGRPTCHAAFGEATAILAGDALLAQAFEVLARHIHRPEVAVRACAELGRAAGAEWLVGGQADDLEAEFQQGSLSLLKSIHARKTGAMFLVSLRLGAIVAEASAAQLTALTTYGEKVGLAFQIVDDLLDLRGDTAAMGKRVGKDSDRGKLTFPALLGQAQSEAEAQRLIDEGIEALAPFDSQAEHLEALARYILERNQ